MNIIQLILAIILGFAFIILALYFLGILMVVALIIGVAVLIAIIIGIFILLLITILAVPYFYFAKKPEIQEFGSYRIEDVKGKNAEEKK